MAIDLNIRGDGRRLLEIDFEIKSLSSPVSIICLGHRAKNPAKLFFVQQNKIGCRHKKWRYRDNQHF